MNYGDKLRDPRWQMKRLTIFNRDNATCQLCGDTKTELQIHHLKYYGEPWEALDEDLITYCKHCHYVVTFIDTNIKSKPKVVAVIKRQFVPEIMEAIVLIQAETAPCFFLFDFEVGHDPKLSFVMKLTELSDIIEKFKSLTQK